jgi:hypothetical protein
MESTFMERKTPGGVKNTSALSLNKGLVFSLLHPPPVFLGGE